MEAWKDGRAGSLARQVPPVRFADDDLSAGWQLLSYELLRPDDPVRPFEPVPVKLRLRDRRGKIVDRTVGYQVALHPRLAVLRADS